MEDAGIFHRPALCKEREARQKAEAERDEARKDLIKNLQTTGGMPWREWSAECAKETRRADENLDRAEKAEAEVERLRGLVNESIVEKSNLSIALVNCQADLRRAKMETAHLFWEELERELDEAQAEGERFRVIGEIAIEQQETLKKLVGEIGTIRLELVAAQESEAVWKTERDKADQRRLEAEAEVERMKAMLNKSK
jgi:hypothetical protein